MRRICRWLGIEKRSRYVDNYFYRANFRSSQYMSVVIIILELWMIGSLAYRWFTGDDSRTQTWYVQHLVWYLVLLAAAVVMLFFTRKYLSNISYKQSTANTGMIMLAVFSVIVLYFGISISDSDYGRGEQILCFVMMTIFVFGLLNWRPIVAITASFAVFLLFYFLMKNASDIEMTYATKVNYVTLWISMVMLEISVYNQRLSEAVKDESLERISVFDELTGIPNSSYFRMNASDILRKQRNTEKLFLFLDIVNFKAYNEKYGYEAGNKLLTVTADKLKECFENDLYARLSDDHFVVLTGREGVDEKLDRLNKAVSEYHYSTLIMVKAGAYAPEDPFIDPLVACDHARYACSMIKKHSDHMLCEYDAAMDSAFQKHQYIITHLEQAVENNFIQVYYQPVVNSTGRNICGAEALARWNDPVYGKLSPAEFIPALEEYRLIHKLDTKILETVCSDIKQFNLDNKSLIPISVNFSRIDFELLDVPALLDELIAKYGISHENIHIEITESALSETEGRLTEAARILHNKKFQLWLDDFGSGYSALNVLKDYEFDVMKIDMVFLKNFHDNEKTRIIIRSIAAMADMLGLETLCEGVETADIAAFLESIGIGKLQGYYFGKPMPFEEFEKLLKA